MTSISAQTVDQLGGPLSVLVLQKRDHVHLDGLLRGLAIGPSRREEDELLRRIAQLVFPHAFAEESVLWPELRRVLPDGEELTRRVEQEHQEVNDLWVALESTAPGADRTAQLERLAVVLREDVRDEEDILLPRLQSAVGRARLRGLGLAWEAVRRVAPTRPHPVVARRPPGNVLAALPLTVLDRARDAADHVARRSPRLGPHATSASRQLAHATGAVERLGLLRQGEDPSTRR